VVAQSQRASPVEAAGLRKEASNASVLFYVSLVRGCVTLTYIDVVANDTTKNDLPRIEADDFARRFSRRAASLMWFLGAGASASAGIPTAWDMIWDFKQQLFISQRRVSPRSVADLSSSVIRAQLQAYIDSSGRFPSLGDPDEYAALFEAVYPAEMDRRAYLDAKMAGAKPSYGHLVLATLMRAQLTRLVWTTNFDPLVADACAKVYGTTGRLTTVDLNAPELAAQCVSERRWPIEVKLHGDFRSRRLKNTSDELRHQDVRLRRVLIDSCRRFGLVIVGYSGRDDSIMGALEEVLEQEDAFPAGLFWLHRGDTPPLPRVGQLLAQATEAGVEATLVPVENFDETLRDLVRLLNDLDTTALDEFATERRHWRGAPRPGGRRDWPVVRLNALPVTQSPSVCRRVDCRIGGHAEVREAVEEAGVDILAARTRAGVLAFGADADVRAAFEPYEIAGDLELHTIETRRLRYDSGERGLLRDALTRALMRAHDLDLTRRHSTDLLAPANPEDAAWKPLRRQVGNLTGIVKGHSDLRWREGVGIRLDWANDRLWLLVEPRIVFDGRTDDNKAVAADFARERTVKRYNRQLNYLIGFWAGLLAAGGDDLRALDVSDGVDAVFRLSSDTGFSARARA
jgi:NAD-dependent SIR2 family protein deacetylase